MHAAPRRTSLRRRPRAGLAVLASLALIAGSMLVWLPLASAITFDPCLLSPELCATLTIQPIGDGYGFVESTKTNGGNADGFIDCVEGAGYVTGTCSHRYFVGSGGPKTLYLYVAPQPGSERCDTLGNCATTPLAGSADLLAGVNRTITVDFRLVNPARLRVGVSGTGTGSITSQPVGIDCGSKCHSDFSVGTNITLTVTPAANSTFRGWSIGPCHGQGAVCTFSIPGDETITADLVGPSPTPTATPKPTPTPKPTAKPTPKPSATAVAPASAAPSAPVVADSAEPSQPEFPAPSAPGVTAVPPGSVVTPSPAPASSAPGPTPTSPAAVNPSGSSGSTDLTPLVVAVLFVGVLLAVAVYFGLRRRPAA